MDNNTKMEGWEALRRAKALCQNGKTIGIDFATVKNPRIVHVESATIRHDRHDTANGDMLVNLHDETLDEDLCCYRCLITNIRLDNIWYEIFWS